MCVHKWTVSNPQARQQIVYVCDLKGFHVSIILCKSFILSLIMGQLNWIILHNMFDNKVLPIMGKSYQSHKH